MGSELGTRARDDHTLEEPGCALSAGDRKLSTRLEAWLSADDGADATRGRRALVERLSKTIDWLKLKLDDEAGDTIRLEESLGAGLALRARETPATARAALPRPLDGSVEMVFLVVNERPCTSAFFRPATALAHFRSQTMWTLLTATRSTEQLKRCICCITIAYNTPARSTPKKKSEVRQT